MNFTMKKTKVTSGRLTKGLRASMMSNKEREDKLRKTRVINEKIDSAK